MIKNSLIFLVFSFALSQSNHRAKIAINIEKGDKTISAKKSNKISTKDGFKIYIQPETDSFIYVINQNDESVTLVNENKKYLGGKLVAFPNEDMFNFTGDNKDEKIILIISPVDEYVLVNLIKKNSSDVENIMNYINEISDKSKIDLGNQQEKPFAIAGNVRAETEINVDKMLIYSGINKIVKFYDFKVKK